MGQLQEIACRKIRIKEITHCKIRIAKFLANGGCGGGYAESIIILCAIIDAIASKVWPCESNKKRFVQLIKDYYFSSCPPKISVPLLYSGISGSKCRLQLKESFPLLAPEELTSTDVNASV